MYCIELERRQTWLFNSKIDPKLKSKYIVPPTEVPAVSSFAQGLRILKVKLRNRLKDEVQPEFQKFIIETVRERFPFLVFTYTVITVINILRHYLLTERGTRNIIMVALGISVLLVGSVACIANSRWRSSLRCSAAFTLFSVFHAFASTYELLVLKGDVSFYNFLFALFDVAITAYIPPGTSLLMYSIVAICSVFFSFACTNFQLPDNGLMIPLIGGLPSLFIFWLPLIGASILRKELLQELYHARKVSGEISKDDIVLAAPKLDLISAVRGSLLSVLQKSVNALPIRGEVLFSHHLGSPNAPAISYASP